MGALVASRVGELRSQAEELVPQAALPEDEGGQEEIAPAPDGKKGRVWNRGRNSPTRSSTPVTHDPVELWCCGHALPMDANAALLDSANSNWSYGGLTVWACRSGERAAWM